MEGSTPTLDALRSQAATQGVEPTEEDLEAVLAFLRGLLPALRELEAAIPPETEP